MKHGLRDLRVIDFSSEIAGPYVTKLLADAGADVIKVEAQEGDSLRSWSARGADLKGSDGAFFQFLNTSKRSVIGHPSDPEILELCAGADLVVGLGYDVIEVEYEAWIGDVPLVHVDIEPADTAPSVNIAHEVIGDLDQTLARINAAESGEGEWPSGAALAHKEMFQQALRP